MLEAVIHRCDYRVLDACYSKCGLACFYSYMKITKKNSNKREVLLSEWLYIIICVVFAIMSFVFFAWGRSVHFAKSGYTIDSDLFGTYGDFFGGVLGTVFSLMSVLLVIKTFQHQRIVTRKTSDQLEIQRFHDLFFELLGLYQTQVAELCSERQKDETSFVRYNNKDFFDFEKSAIQKSYRNRKSFESNQEAALSYYMLFYIENRTKLGAYYRTLYRIYDLIDSSNLEEAIKRDYLKIMRAQLTESELFFMRYNAMTFYGSHFVNYINKYNILKHLPAFELLEFKDWWIDLNPVERTGVNILFAALNKAIRGNIYSVVTGFVVPPTAQDDKFVLLLNSNGSNELLVSMIVYENRENHYNELRAFEKFEAKRIQQLLDCFIKEIFQYSNFNRFNEKSDLETFSNPIRQRADGVTLIDSGIRNSKKKALIIKQTINKEPEGNL